MPALENVQHETFCQEYLVDFNGTQAAIRSGYAPGNERSAQSNASRLLSIPIICDRVKELHLLRVNEIKMDVGTILRECLRLATCDVGLAFNEDRSLKAIHEIPEDVRRCIAGFEEEEIWEGTGRDRVYVGQLRKVKFWDKNKAIEQAGKHLKLWTEKFEVQGTLTLESLVMGEGQKNERPKSSDVVPAKAIGPGGD